MVIFLFYFFFFPISNKILAQIFKGDLENKATNVDFVLALFTIDAMIKYLRSVRAMKVKKSSKKNDSTLCNERRCFYE